MAASDLGAVVGLISFVQQLGENYYRASDALTVFKSNVPKIERMHQDWKERAAKYGLSLDPSLQGSLDEAQQELEREKTRLENLQKRGGYRWAFKLRGTAFPSQVGQKLQSLLELDGIILEKWRAKEIADREAQKRVEEFVRSPTFAFRKDERYVRLPDIEGEIQHALENLDATSRVVLLYGPPGTGKSCMARHLALDYATTPITTTSASENFASTTLGRCPRFQKVLYLECGDQVDFTAKQREMLHSLGWKRGSLQPEVSIKEADDANLRGLLKQFLKEMPILIIVDDVWDESFLEGMEELCGQHVRILVTSQRSGLCGKSSMKNKMKSISMDRITREAAGDILKVHAGFDIKAGIAGPIQDCMDILVEKVSMNPHALASIATAIDHRRPHQLMEWKNAVREYDSLLNTTGPPVMNIHGISYPSSFENAIQVKFERLGMEEKRVMMLLTMLQGPSVPEQIVQLFFNEIVVEKQGVRSSSTQFSKSRRLLEDLLCVKVEEVENGNSWSIHSLDRQFVQKFLKNDMSSMFKKVQNLPNIKQGLELEFQVHFLQIIGALYFSEEWGKCIAVNLSFPLADTRITIQPIIFLMMENVHENWSEIDQSSTDQVFITYMIEGIIHEKAAKTLLSSPMSNGTFCNLILSTVEISDISLGENIIIDLLRRFGDLNMSENSSNALELNLDQCHFLNTLVRAGAVKDRHLLRLSICKINSIVLGLTEILSSRWDNPRLQLLSGQTLGWLATGQSPNREEDRQTLLANTPMLVEGLIRCLEDTNGSYETNERSFVQDRVAWCLESLAQFAGNWSPVGLKLANTGCKQLVESLGNKTRPLLQMRVARALFHTAYAGRQPSLKIFNCPEAVTCLLGILDSTDSSDHIRGIAAAGLGDIMINILPFSDPEADANSLRIKKISNCLDKLLAKGPDISLALREAIIVALTSIDPAKGKSFPLHSAAQLRTRGRRLVQLGHFQDGLSDLMKALQLDETHPRIFCCSELKEKLCKHLQFVTLLLHPIYWYWCPKFDPQRQYFLSFAKSKLGDWEDALTYADRAVERSDFKDPFAIQERGVLRRMMGDLHGALNDFDESLKFDPNDYERLKHRAYVKFLLSDENGAVADAEKARRYRLTQYDVPSYENKCLGTSAVEFLDFRL